MLLGMRFIPVTCFVDAIKMGINCKSNFEMHAVLPEEEERENQNGKN
jgi:hypothetical protein